MKKFLVTKAKVAALSQVGKGAAFGSGYALVQQSPDEAGTPLTDTSAPVAQGPLMDSTNEALANDGGWLLWNAFQTALPDCIMDDDAVEALVDEFATQLKSVLTGEGLSGVDGTEEAQGMGQTSPQENAPMDVTMTTGDGASAPEPEYTFTAKSSNFNSLNGLFGGIAQAKAQDQPQPTPQQPQQANTDAEPFHGNVNNEPTQVQQPAVGPATAPAPAELAQAGLSPESIAILDAVKSAVGPIAQQNAALAQQNATLLARIDALEKRGPSSRQIDAEFVTNALGQQTAPKRPMSSFTFPGKR